MNQQRQLPSLYVSIAAIPVGATFNWNGRIYRRLMLIFYRRRQLHGDRRRRPPTRYSAYDIEKDIYIDLPLLSLVRQVQPPAR